MCGVASVLCACDQHSDTWIYLKGFLSISHHLHETKNIVICVDAKDITGHA